MFTKRRIVTHSTFFYDFEPLDIDSFFLWHKKYVLFLDIAMRKIVKIIDSKK